MCCVHVCQCVCGMRVPDGCDVVLAGLVCVSVYMVCVSVCYIYI